MRPVNISLDQHIRSQHLHLLVDKRGMADMAQPQRRRIQAKCHWSHI